MNLLWQTCSIIKKIESSVEDGTPIYVDSIIASGVPCRLDTQISNYLRTTQRDLPQSNVEEYHGILYMDPNDYIDDTCNIMIDGDNRLWEIAFIQKPADMFGIHHFEVEVRTAVHR